MWEVFKQLKDKIYFVNNIVYKNKSRNHKSQINSYEAFYKEIEGKESIFNYNDWINDPETKVSILVKTQECDSLLKEKTKALNNLTTSEYFDSNFREDISVRILCKLKEREIWNNAQICNHSIIKLYNKEFVGYFTITNRKIMKVLIYETNENAQSKIDELICDPSIIGSNLNIFGLGQVYTNKEKGDILKTLYLDSSLHREVKLDSQESVEFDKFQKVRVDDFKQKLGNKNSTNLVTEIREELATHKVILLNGSLQHTDKNIFLVPYEIGFKNNVNNDNLIEILKGLD